MMDQIRSNVSKANVVGRLVSGDQTAALVIAGLMEYNPLTDKEISYSKVGNELEHIRAKFEKKYDNISIHIIGFAVLVKDMIEA